MTVLLVYQHSLLHPRNLDSKAIQVQLKEVQLLLQRDASTPSQPQVGVSSGRVVELHMKIMSNFDTFNSCMMKVLCATKNMLNRRKIFLGHYVSYESLFCHNIRGYNIILDCSSTLCVCVCACMCDLV